MEDSLLVKLYLDKNESKLNPEIYNCLEQIMIGFVGRFQLHHQGKDYCCRSKEYCSVQKDEGLGMKKCRGMELYNEVVKYRN